MTPAGMAAFRKSAALVHTLPGLRLRITHDGTPLAEIGQDVCVRTEGWPMRLTQVRRRRARRRRRSPRGERAGAT